MVLLMCINGHRHDSTTDDGFALVMGVADGTTDLATAAAKISAHPVPR